MEFREFKGKTVHDAITEALIELEITSDMIEYEVIEEGSAGLLGLFSKNAVIRARRKEDAGADEVLFDIKAEIRSGSSLLDGEEKSKAEKKAAKPSQKEKETEADKAVKQNLKEIAKKAFKLLYEQMNGDENVCQIVANAHLELRDSTKN